MPKPKLIPTPELLLNYFLEYANEIKTNPIRKMVFVGKDGRRDFEEKERPLSLSGFEVYLFKREIIGDLSHYFANTKNMYDDFKDVTELIKKIIRNDQIEGGMAGIYNASLTGRLNGLSENINQTVETKEIFKGLDLNVTTNNRSIEDRTTEEKG